MTPGEYERQGDGKRFHVRALGEEWQVYGRGLEHIAMCSSEDHASMVADALELAATVEDRTPKKWQVVR